MPAEGVRGEMIDAARAYALAAKARELGVGRLPYIPFGWPWGQAWWKPSTDPIRNLVKAGALIAAEIDRLLVLAATPEQD